MSWHPLLMYLPLLLMLTGAAAIDLRTRRIPNALAMLIAATGLMQCFGTYPTVSSGQAGLGLLVGGALGFALFAIGALGGGDVKLLGGAGAWLGPGPVFYVFILTAVVGMAMVLVQAMAKRRLGVLCRNSAVIAINLIHIQDLGTEHAAATGTECRSVDKPLPYAVPVLAATVLLLVCGRVI